MKKLLILALLLSGGFVVCMERPGAIIQQKTTNSNEPIALCHIDIIPQITEYLCLSYNKEQGCNNFEYVESKLFCIKKDIRSLFETNKFLHDYYAQEENAQKIVRCCSLCLDSNDEDVAKILRYPIIEEKLNCLFAVCRNNRMHLSQEKLFAEEDLKDPWYLNSTSCLNQSLLYVAINRLHLKKAQSIIDCLPLLDFRYGCNQDVLTMIVTCFRQVKNWHHYPDMLLEITRCLLKRGLLANRTMGCIPLVEVVSHGAKEFARLLLEYGADPYVKQYSMYTDKYTNSFEAEYGKPKGWLRKMVDEIELNKSVTNKMNNLVV